jgi:tRNA(Ile2) C34 agmatinyltransferase TiaS
VTAVIDPHRPSSELTLEDVVLRALAEARVRRPERRPACPVCAAQMWVVERNGGRLELHCGGCGSVLADDSAAESSRRLGA